METEKIKYLEMHRQHHNVWFNQNTNQWMTYFNDLDSGKGLLLRKRKKKSDLEALIIEYYKKRDALPRIADIFHEWIHLKFQYGEITPQSKTRYENSYRRFFPDDNPICSKPFRDISSMDLEIFIKGNIKTHKLTKKTYGDLKILLKGIFRHARKKAQTAIIISVFFDELYLSKNIFNIQKKKTDAEEIYTEDEIPLLKEYLLQKNSLHYLGVLLVFVTGMRVGELSALKPGDIQLRKNGSVLCIRRTEIHYSAEDESGKRRNVTEVQVFPKSDAGNRDIILNRFAVQILEQIRRLNPCPKEYLFEKNGQRIKNRGFSGALKRTCEKLNIPFRPMHKIRKTYGTTLLDNHVSETLVANQMGHSDISTTKRYYYRNNKTRAHQAAEIERALSSI